MLESRPCTIRFAKKWIAEYHRHLPKMQGALWAVKAVRNGKDVGVSVVGNPAQQWQKEDILCLLRMAVKENEKNVCSFLYGVCSRIAKTMGAIDLVTYTLPIEPGTSLKAAGWIYAGMTEGGEYDRPSRPRQKTLFPEPKKRWFAPWGKRAKEIQCQKQK